MPIAIENPSRTRVPRHRSGGFTLLELMVVGVIVAVLAAVALPSYADYIQRSKISEAITNLSDMRTRLEQFYLDNRSYPAAPGNCVTTGTTSANINLPPAQKYFQVTCTAMSAAAYTITATGVASQGMGGFAYTIDQGNNRATTAVPSGWSKSATCWTIRKSGDC
jgi:type IV pilus assembly protein PilE